jgi:hypothetical protein
MNKLNYAQAIKYLKEGDVLLFRGHGLISAFIKRFGEGKYSHVGIASKHEDIWECVEFREWKGGRSVNLEKYVEICGCEIDVYRPISSRKIIIAKTPGSIEEREIPLEATMVTKCMRKMTGLPYGWKRIWWIATHKIPILRFLYNIESVTNDRYKDLIYPICSTAVAYAFNSVGYDLIHNRSDEYTEPSDLATSALIFYLFTISA